MESKQQLVFQVDFTIFNFHLIAWTSLVRMGRVSFVWVCFSATCEWLRLGKKSVPKQHVVKKRGYVKLKRKSVRRSGDKPFRFSATKHSNIGNKIPT